jgi:hypothetical protein
MHGERAKDHVWRPIVACTRGPVAGVRQAALSRRSAQLDQVAYGEGLRSTTVTCLSSRTICRATSPP